MTRGAPAPLCSSTRLVTSHGDSAGLGRRAPAGLQVRWGTRGCGKRLLSLHACLACDYSVWLSRWVLRASCTHHTAVPLDSDPPMPSTRPPVQRAAPAYLPPHPASLLHRDARLWFTFVGVRCLDMSRPKGVSQSPPR